MNFRRISGLSAFEQRIFLSRVLLYVSILALAVVWRYGQMVFYVQAKNTPADLWRLLWLLPFMFLGMAIRAYRRRGEDGLPYKPYLKYLVYLSAANFVLFAMCHAFLAMDNWLFYPIAGMGSLVLPQPDGLPERIGTFITSIFKV